MLRPKKLYPLNQLSLLKMAKRVTTILPPPSSEESIEIAKICSVLGMVDKEYPLITGRPFRSVHHTVTRSALIGGGVLPVPGEISLAHGGGLFLDELAEFPKPVLEGAMVLATLRIL